MIPTRILAMTDAKTMPTVGTKTHPYLATLVMDPADGWRFERDFEDRPEVMIMKVDRRTPDHCTVYVGCASQRVQDLIESNW
jgi:hypothetical protein